MTNPPQDDGARGGEPRAGRPEDLASTPGPWNAPPGGTQPYGQPPFGAPRHGQLPADPWPPPYGPPQYGPPQYGQPQYGQRHPGPWQHDAPRPGAPGHGAPQQYGAPRPARVSRRGPVLGLLLLVAVVVVAVGLAATGGSTVLSRSAVEQDVAEQFEQREGVAVDLECAEEMSVEVGATYECTGVTADDEQVTLRIEITDAAGARYTWSEP